MKLRTALRDYKQTLGSETEFPGERRSTTGMFSGIDGRLVHVDPDGSLRDFSYPLTGLAGIESLQFGLYADDEITWFDEFETRRQEYAADTAVVETEHTDGTVTIVQRDLTLDSAHVTNVEAQGVEDGELCISVTFAPETAASRVGQLAHQDALEVYHRREHDYLAASTDFGTLLGQVPEGIEEVLDSAGPVEFPRAVDGGRYEQNKLGGTAFATVPFDDSGSVTVVSLLTEIAETSQHAALDEVTALAEQYAAADSVLEAGEAQMPDWTSGLDDETGSTDDLRVLSLLSANTGARIAGPDFDPTYTYSGGYGYTWFRDDAEISRFLLETDQRTDLDLSAWHEASAQFYADTQRPDGTWPHRVWPSDGSLAPGWAHGRIEAGENRDSTAATADRGEGTDYQADQTGSVAAFLGTYLRIGDPEDPEAIESVLADAVEGLDDTLEGTGLPQTAQNAWENMTGQFAHTAATFLHAYAAVARSPVKDELADHAAEQADAVYDGIDDLWMPDRGAYAIRLEDGELDERLDSSALALAGAHHDYAAVGQVDDQRLDRLVSHLSTTIEGLYRDPEGSDVRGLIRFEGDEWRMREQSHEKIWTVSTAWGANSATKLARLLDEHDRAAASEMADCALDLMTTIRPGGSLCLDSTYLPEQVFDDGTPDSATPLGWPHALRLATETELAAMELNEAQQTMAADD
ncbi:glucan 1,4-alpha-glucosidase [Natronoarchaeum sp. GCM10025321]|uniref:glucan 1,4-alpha-glucosidase n=1 Tax=Natronoarchaeum sp. GCM10025321 TaxID=3252684 RepID=UPI003612A5D6